MDVHRWSEHREVNKFIDEIYENYFKGGSARIRKSHLKVVLLDLYVAWKDDPNLRIHYSRNVNSYRPKSRYNALHISKMTIIIADTLEGEGFIEQVIGFKDRETGVGFQSRMWPTEKLLKLFRKALFSKFDIRDHEGRETIILKNDKKEKIEYKDTEETCRMRLVVQNYNELLRQTFIDIPELEEPRISLGKDVKGQEKFLVISQSDKLIHRIFNRGSFQKGGRFYGGWWQRCPKDWRQKIFIDDEPTIELDFTGLHIMLLYAKEGIDYLSSIGGDPYEIDPPRWLNDPQELRNLAKRLLLVAVNAKNEKVTFQAFRGDEETGSPHKKLENKQLKEVLDALREKHPKIEKYFASDAGIDLMSTDAKITERVISHFTNQGIPILTIHDSYIIRIQNREELWMALVDAFEKETDLKLNVRPVDVRAPKGIPPKEFWEQLEFTEAGWSVFVRDKYKPLIAARLDPNRSGRYMEELRAFRRHSP